jgi:FixJ family two-component response regulator
MIEDCRRSGANASAHQADLQSENLDVADIAKIAVIDDDESVRDALESLLKSVGFKAESFASAAEFLNCGQLLGLSCLILDVRMPGMSGIELQDRLVASHDGVPIIFISAHADEEARARALASGAIAFLVKPFSDEALLGAIDAALRLPRS